MKGQLALTVVLFPLTTEKDLSRQLNVDFTVPAKIGARIMKLSIERGALLKQFLRHNQLWNGATRYQSLQMF